MQVMQARLEVFDEKDCFHVPPNEMRKINLKRVQCPLSLFFFCVNI